MRRRSRLSPSRLEALEVRILPAAVAVSSSTLRIADQVGVLRVETTSVEGQIRVTDDNGTFVFNGVTTKIMIQGTAQADEIRFLANDSGNLAFLGLLDIRSGDGDDTVQLSGSVGGNLVLQSGLGSDNVILDADVAIGGSVTSTDSAGQNSFILNTHNFAVGKNLTLNGVSSFVTGAGNTLTVGGSMSVATTKGESNALTVAFVGTAVNIGGNLKVTGGAQHDVAVMVSELSIGGSAAFRFGGGDNTLVLQPLAGGSGIHGDLCYQGTTGANSAIISSYAFVAGDTVLNLGDGSGSAILVGDAQFGGNVSVFGGNASNTVIMNSQIQRNLSIRFASNSISNTTIIYGQIGGCFMYQGSAGDASEVLLLAPNDPLAVHASIAFGHGDSTFIVSSNVTLGGKVTGTGGTCTFSHSGAVLLPTLVFKNYP